MESHRGHAEKLFLCRREMNLLCSWAYLVGQGWWRRFEFFARVSLRLLSLLISMSKNVVHGHDPWYLCYHMVV